MFDWDEQNTAPIARHNVAPAEVEQVIANDPIDLERTIRGGEERVVQVGVTDAGRTLLVVLTSRPGGLRVVTAHETTRKLRALYAAQRKQHDKEND